MDPVMTAAAASLGSLAGNLVKFLGAEGYAMFQHMAEGPEKRSLLASFFFREWDDRIGESRLWLMRRNPHWLTAEGSTRSVAINLVSPRAMDAETAHRANLILNFFEDIELARKRQAILLDDLGELPPSLYRWWCRLQVLDEHLRQEDPRRGWDKARNLMGEIVVHSRLGDRPGAEP